MSYMFVPNFEAIGCVTLVLEPENRPQVWHKKRSHSKSALVRQKTEVESSRTHFEVLGLGLEASSPRKLACPRFEDSTIF